MNLVLIEDNASLRESVRGYLELEGYMVKEYSDIPSADVVLADNPDCVILDIMLPSGNGMLLGKKIREISSVPLIFLTARVSESDRITGLEVGADDYVTKPFSPRELVLRVNALLRRWRSSDREFNSSKDENTAVNMKKDSGNRELKHYSLGDGSIEIDESRHSLLVDSEDVKVTAAEWNILLFLSKNPGQIFSRLQLLEYCLNSFAEGSERTVDTHVKNLRHKLGNHQWIETERGFGYRFAGKAER